MIVWVHQQEYLFPLKGKSCHQSELLMTRLITRCTGWSYTKPLLYHNKTSAFITQSMHSCFFLVGIKTFQINDCDIQALEQEECIVIWIGLFRRLILVIWTLLILTLTKTSTWSWEQTQKSFMGHFHLSSDIMQH